jgi:hypothetical protein
VRPENQCEEDKYSAVQKGREVKEGRKWIMKGERK